MTTNDDNETDFDAATEIGKVKRVLENFLEISEMFHEVCTEQQNDIERLYAGVELQATGGLALVQAGRSMTEDIKNLARTNLDLRDHVEALEEEVSDLKEVVNTLKGEVEALRALVLAQLDIDLPTDGAFWPHKYETRDALRSVVQKDARLNQLETEKALIK